MVTDLQEKVVESENRAYSFEKFLNHSNPMGMPYVLNPGRSEVNLPVNYNLPNLRRGTVIPSYLR